MAQAPAPEGAGNADPSMDDILASIRRILSDEEKTRDPGAQADGVFMLDPSMMVDDTTPVPPELEAEMQAAEAARRPAAEPAAEESAVPPEPAAPPPPSFESLSPPPPTPAQLVAAPQVRTIDGAGSLVAPEAAAAAASSVSQLMRTLVSERTTAVSRGGPTLEDLVREEIRPLLKGWLDAHLPGIVERLVRAEIERVVGRSAG